MKILAIDLSCEVGSLAWVVGGQVVQVREWTAERRQSRPVFADLMALIRDGTLDPAGLDRLAVGVGPGAFSGLRAAVSLVRALALPGSTPVTAVSSARALAHRLMTETGAARVVVFGDARRNEIWAGCFERVQGLAELQGDWMVGALGQLPSALEHAGSVWVTPDWDRLGQGLTACCPSSVTLISEVRRPCATQVAELAAGLVAGGREGEAPVPIYVHPAVSVAPRF